MRNRYNDGNVGVIEYDYTHIAAFKTKISKVKVTYLDGHSYETTDLGEFLQWCCNDRARVLFVWDMNFFGAFLDYWALSRGIPAYDREKTERGSKGVIEECFSGLYTRNGMLNFKLTLKRTAGTHRQYYKQGVKEGHHTVEFRGLAGYYGGIKLDKAIESLHIPAERSKSEKLIALLKYCAKEYETITGEEFFSTRFLSSTYTCGRAARDLYLKMRYGKVSLNAYQKEHAQTEALEDYFRERRLLLGGMCIINPKYTGALCVRKNGRCFYKYDKNGLYSHIANKVGELGLPESSSFKEYQRDKSGTYTYIIVFNRLDMLRRSRFPRAFSDPFLKTDEDGIEIHQEFAMFGELFEELNVFYDIDVIEVSKVFKCKKLPDPHMLEYNAHLLKYKDEGRQSNNRALYTIAKIFLNGLLGKFAQQTKQTPVQPYYDKEEDIVRFDLGEEINGWDSKHFDYIRGAYIYTMARVEIMKDMEKLFADKKSIIARHWYTDTDSIVTDIEFPAEYLSPTELGKYKIEERYIAFGVIGKKLYYGRTVDGADKIVCAGLPKKDIERGIAQAFPQGLSPFQYFNYLNSDNGMDLDIAARCSGGSCIKSVKYTLDFVTRPLEF